MTHPTNDISLPAQVKRVGMIGLGLMGSAIARSVLRRGFEVTVLAHRSRDALNALLAEGAREAGSAAELARNADAVLICVTGTPQVRDVFYREGGLLEGAHPGLIVVDSSTSDPGFASEAADALRAKGAAFVDAPVNRTPKEAAEGRLNVLAGGDAAAIEVLRPLFAAYGETLHHLGAHGAGYRAKLIHNFIAQANSVVVAEAFGTAAKAGLDLAAFADVCRLSGAHSKSFERVLPYLLAGDDSAQQFALRNAAKDMRSYSALATEMATTAIVAEAVRQVYQLACNLGHGEQFVPRLFDVYAELNGEKPRS